MGRNSGRKSIPRRRVPHPWAAAWQDLVEVVVFGEVGPGPLGLVLLMSAVFAPFHTHTVDRQHSSACWGPRRLGRQSLILILRLLGCFAAVSLTTLLVMGAGDVVVGGDGYGDGVVGVVEMLKAVMAVMVAVALILDSWWS